MENRLYVRSLIVAAALVLAGALSPVRADDQASSQRLASLTPFVSRFISTVDQRGHEIRGRLVRVSDDEVMLDINRSMRAISARDIHTIAVRTNSWQRGAIVGIGIGVPVAVVAVAIADKPGSAGGKIAAAVIGIATYAAVGALIGRAFHHYTVVFRNDSIPMPPDHGIVGR